MDTHENRWWARVDWPQAIALTIVAVALAESYVALYEVADKAGAKLPLLFPLPIDLLDVLVVWVLTRRKHAGLRETWWAWLMLVGLTALSAGLQVTLVDTSDRRNVIVAVSAPVLAVLGVKVAQALSTRRADASGEVAVSAPAASEPVNAVSAPSATVGTVTAAELPVLRSVATEQRTGGWAEAAERLIAAERVSASGADTVRDIASELDADGSLSKAEVAKLLGCSRPTVSQWVTRMEAHRLAEAG